MRLNASSNGLLAPPLGYPFRLTSQTETYASGVVPQVTGAITVTFKPDFQADVHLALYSAPLTVGGSDSALLAQTDVLAASGSTYQTISVSVPSASSLVPASVVGTGTITISANSQSVTGGATAFPVDGQWNGFEIQVKGGTWYQIASVQSTTTLILSTPTAAILDGSGAFYVRRPQPVAFTVVLWCDNIQGGRIETVIRDPAITVASSQPVVPGGITVSSVVFS